LLDSSCTGWSQRAKIVAALRADQGRCGGCLRRQRARAGRGHQRAPAPDPGAGRCGGGGFWSAPGRWDLPEPARLGPVLGARVLAEFGDDPARYAAAKARRNYPGSGPGSAEVCR